MICSFLLAYSIGVSIEKVLVRQSNFAISNLYAIFLIALMGSVEYS